MDKVFSFLVPRDWLLLTQAMENEDLFYLE